MKTPKLKLMEISKTVQTKVIDLMIRTALKIHESILKAHKKHEREYMAQINYWYRRKQRVRKLIAEYEDTIKNLRDELDA